VTSIRARCGQLAIIIASGVMLLFLVLPLLVLLVRALEADLLQQLTQPTVAHALRLSLLTSIPQHVDYVILGTPLAYAGAAQGARPIGDREPCSIFPLFCHPPWLVWRCC
jgi:ABC-type sulfate transport system permease component